MNGATVSEERTHDQRKALSRYPTGVAVVTAMYQGRPVGLAVGSFTSVSLEPALVGFFVATSSTTWPLIRCAGRFAVNVLNEGQSALSRRFATSGGSKFTGLSWHLGESGAPILDGSALVVECDLERVVETGDHLLVLGGIRALWPADLAQPLVFLHGRYGRVDLLATPARGGQARPMAT
jgi:3-hydroxy-9,10-secoandrosta-1,3,5(10)-triene-9,17-dione monooxygenase reductase component